ncbi:HAD-IA family hydrolase [Prochlorococcus sp. MIT 1307]|uniref:HAD family hydrolase n=1 Tax=Prochlorococcus sp. MIT 1307 TaxID=3096219 RepID=UPI002A762989|nr:HAD-IA family hydrolase [Prochlorococcus sp. MIT 1307]
MPTILLRGEPIGTIKGVLFDKDGTLSNSEEHLLKLAELRVQTASQLLKEKGASSKAIKNLQELLPKAYGLNEQGISPNGTTAIASRAHNLLSTATVLCLIGETWPKALELSNKVFRLVDLLDEKISNKSIPRTLLPGVRITLQNLREANITCALISNDSGSGIQSFLSKHNLKSLFNNFWSADHSPAKPHPAAVIGLCNKLNLHPSECALIGDADSDLLMARQSGVGITLGYTGGWSQKPHLTKHEYLINKWNELTIKQSKH